MVDIGKRDQDRERFLLALFEAVEGDRFGMIDYRAVADQIGMDHADAEPAASWLVDEGLADWAAMGGLTRITHEGVRAAEEALRESSGGATSQISEFIDHAEVGDIEVVIAQLRKVADDDSVDLEPDERADLLAQVQTAEAQMKSPKPRRSIVAAALKASTWVLDHAANGVIGAGAVAGAHALLALWG